MNILIIADLHLDLWARAGRDPFAGIVPVLRDLDALIIAGDLANDPQRNWPWALSRITRLVSPAWIWVIPGNHDYYGTTLDDGVLARIAAETGAHLAQKSVLTFGSCRILCYTLWTDFALLGDPGSAMERAKMAMADYGRIRRKDGDISTPQDTAAIHRDHLDWLTHEIAKPWRGQTVVVTHHAPSAAAAGPCPASVQPLPRILMAGSMHTGPTAGSSVIPISRSQPASAGRGSSTSRSAIPARCPKAVRPTVCCAA
ncbi:metallophosphoesterase [Paracoccus marcusii]|uniref:metallophosphoesterase n=1 Tax=Paracoccus marcusii TaxID=59779 RepID=UPI0032672FD1